MPAGEGSRRPLRVDTGTGSRKKRGTYEVPVGISQNLQVLSLLYSDIYGYSILYLLSNMGGRVDKKPHRPERRGR